MLCFPTVWPLIVALVAQNRPLPPSELLRLGNVAADVCRAAEVAPIDGGATRTAIELVAIGWHESRFNARVERCIDQRGPSIGLFQLEGKFAIGPYTKQELCESTEKQAERALVVLRRYHTRATPTNMYSGYHNGELDTKSGREMAGILGQLLRWVKLKP